MPNVSRTLKGGDFVLAYFRDNYTPNLTEKFVRVYTAESLLIPFDESIQQRIINRYGEIYAIATRVLSSAEINTVERCINNMGHLNEIPIITPESVGAHTNLVSILIDEVLDFTYGYDKAPKGFNRRHIQDAARIHDLPEIHYGDTRDDGIRNEAVKQELERKFFQEYDKFLQENQKDSILRLLQEMEEKSTPSGKLLYVADKAAAPITALAYEKKYAERKMGTEKMRSKLPQFALGELNPDSRNYQLAVKELGMSKAKDTRNLSELWIADYLQCGRNIGQYDETGVMTAILVMSVLIVNDGEWYSWREKAY